MASYNSTTGRSVGFSDYWWFILSLVPFLNWLPLFLAGVKTKKVKWIFWGILYLSTLVSYYLFTAYIKDIPHNEMIKSLKGLLAMSFFTTWIISIFHTFNIKKEFLYYLSQIPQRFVQTTTYDRRTGRQINHLHQNLGKHGRIIATIESLQKQISHELKEKEKKNIITDDLDPIVDKYVTQTKELAAKDVKLEKLLKNTNPKEVDFKVRELKRKIERTDNAQLMQQYMDSISNLEHSKEMISDFEDQREMIRLKLDGAQMELRKIKMNLINMQDLSSQEQNTSYVKDFETKSQELTTYLELLNNYK